MADKVEKYDWKKQRKILKKKDKSLKTKRNRKKEKLN